MNDPVSGKNDRVVRFHVRYALLLFLIFAILMAAFLILLTRQYKLHDASERRLLLNRFMERSSSLDHLLADVIARVEGIRITAEDDLMQTRHVKTLIQPLAFNDLKESFHEDGKSFNLDEFKPPVTESTTGNLTGEGSVLKRDPSFYREIHMALNLNPQFAAVSKSLKDAAWVYYTSANDFINIYPWVSSKDFRFSKELQSHEFFVLGLPRNNPERKIFWTDVYIDEYGKGLMTTCAAPVYDGDTFLGTVAIDLTVDFLNTIIKDFEGGQGVLFLVNDRDQLLAHPTLVTSRDKQTKSLREALPGALGNSIDGFLRIPDNEIAEMDSFSVLKSHLHNAAWQIAYVKTIPSFGTVLVERIGTGALILLSGLLILVVTISVVTHTLFILPSEKFVNFILARSGKDRVPMDRDVPKVWEPWFNTIENIFRENEELTEKVRKQNEELEERVEERTAELGRINDRLMILLAERKRAEKALRESESKLAGIIEFLPDATFVIDLEGKVIAWNRAIEEMTGVGKKDMLGQGDHAYTVPFYGERRKHLLDLIDADDEELESRYQNVQRIGNTLHAEAFAHALYGNRGAYIFASGAPLFDLQGNRVGAIESIRDITERKKAEEERKKLEARLRQVQKMEAVGTLAGGIAHDFNNLLMGIRGYATMAKIAVDPSNRTACRDLERIDELISSGASLSKQLLGFARGGRYEFRVIHMGKLLKNTVSMFGRAKKEITLLEKYPGDLWPVEADRGQMEQVFMNLLVNAWQAMPGGGRIDLEAANVFLDESFSDGSVFLPGRYVKISIADTGTGMDEKTRERIFEPFFTTKEMGRGTGLGLATVYGIVRGHKGAIQVSSRKGQGTTFDVYLPATDKRPAEEESGGEETPGEGETVLVVDDEGVVLEVTKRILERLGYRVLAAGGGSEALKVYAEKKSEIDLVVLDMIMPGLGGGETFERLKELNPDVKVLLSSGYSFAGEAEKIFRKGCRGFLQKPFTKEELSRKLREAIGGGVSERRS